MTAKKVRAIDKGTIGDSLVACARPDLLTATHEKITLRHWEPEE